MLVHRVVRRLGLAEAADVVALALDRHERGVADRRAVDLLPRCIIVPSRQGVVLEHGLDRLQVELGRQVHDRQVLVVEVLVLLDRVAVALDEIVEQVDVRVHVALEVHGHEAGELDEARIDVAHEAGVRQRHGRDHVLLEPVDRARLRQLVDGGRVAPRVDRPAHQRHATPAGRDRRVAAMMRGRGQHRHGRLAHADHVRVGSDALG